MDVMANASASASQRFASHPILEAQVQDLLAAVYAKVGQLAQAKIAAQRALSLYRSQLGPDDPRSIVAESRVIGSALNLNQTAEAGRAIESLLPRATRILGPDDPTTLEVRRARASLLLVQGRLDEAETLFLELRVHPRLADDDRMQSRILYSLCRIRQRRPVSRDPTQLAADLHAAEQLARECVEHSVRASGPGSVDVLRAKSALAQALCDARRFREAEELCRTALADSASRFEDCHLNRRNVMCVLADAAAGLGRFDESADLYKKIIECARSSAAPDPITLLSNLGDALKYFDRSGRATEGEALAREGLTLLAKFGGAHESIGNVFESYVAHFVSTRGRTDEAEPLFEDELPADDEAEEPAPSAGNIVPLRPQQPARRADTALRSPAAELSPGEKSAFEEIGRTLGVERAAESADDEPKLSPAATKRARDLIDLVARFGRSDEPAEQPAPPPPPLAAVSEDTSAQIAAQLPERNAAAVLERLPVGIVVSRFNVPIYANRTLLELLDYSDIDAFHAAGGLDRLFRGRAPDSGAAQIETRDGEVLPVDARVQAVDWDGQPATLVTLRRAQENRSQENRSQENRPQENRPQDAGDAARAKALELDLRQRDAEARELHAILDTATDGVAVLDADGRILSLNRSGEALFGFDQNEVAGEPLSILVARESQDAVAAYFDGVKSGGVQSVLNDGREIFARARQGGSIPVFVTLGRLGSGATPKFCAVLRDLTAWKKAERELGDARREAERASALKSDFLAKVSHEIRTPLNAILGFAEVIMDERFGPVGNARYRDYMRDIHKSGEHVLSLVNDLLDLSKIEAGKVDLTFTSVDINAVVAECVSLMQPQANRDRVVMRLSLAPNLPNIVADERSMRQIVLNLLSNAVKFNEPGGQAIVSTALTDAGHAVVRIKDTGVGMSDDELQTALEPFRQVSTARKSGGTGLGLPLTKALVEANRASFTIRSRKGEGTMVEVTFPPTRVLAE